MENFNKIEISFEDEKLNNLISDLNQTFLYGQKGFSKLCKGVYEIWYYCNMHYWKAKNDEQYNSYSLLAKFGFDKKAVSRYKNCYLKFIESSDIDTKIKSAFYGFTSSKLFELLTVSDSQLEKDLKSGKLKPEMTVKEIREYVKHLKSGSGGAEKVLEDQNPEINEEEIPLAYDPTQEYEFTYFERLSKSQLLNIVWELQKFAHSKTKQRKLKAV